MKSPKPVSPRSPKRGLFGSKEEPSSQVILTSSDIVHPDNWVDKQSRAKCYVCSRQFHSLVRPKHNCRKCGEVICAKCRVAQILHMPSVPAKEYSPILICLVCNHGLPTESFAEKLAKNQPRSLEPYTMDMAPLPTPEYAASHSGFSSLGPSQDPEPEPMIQCPYELDWDWDHPWPKPPVLPSVVERQQMELLYSLNILDTQKEDTFDRIAVAARKFTSNSCKVACVSFMDLHQERQWFKGSCGLAQSEMPRMISFCTHTIYLNQPVVVLDARYDQRYCHNPLVTGSGQFKFYASVPINFEGVCIGTIFVLDAETRTEHEVDISKLVKLSHIVTKLLMERRGEVRTKARKASMDITVEKARKASMDITADMPVPPTPITERHPRSYSIDVTKSRRMSADVGELPPPAPLSRPPSPPSVAENQITQSEQKVAADQTVATGGNSMESMLMNLLSQTTQTQQQIANQQGSMYKQLGEHSSQLNMLAEAVARMEAKLQDKDAKTTTTHDAK